LVAVVAGAAIAANLALLHYAASGNAPVGKLSPRAHLPAAPANVIRPETGHVEHDRSDD
jgi:hypothetical protein